MALCIVELAVSAPHDDTFTADFVKFAQSKKLLVRTDGDVVKGPEANSAYVFYTLDGTLYSVVTPDPQIVEDTTKRYSGGAEVRVYPYPPGRYLM